MAYLLDTCVLSEFVKPAPDAAVSEWISAAIEEQLFVSAITLAELHRGIARLTTSKRQQALIQWIKALETTFAGRVLPFTEQTASCWGTLTAAAERRGQPLAAFDSLIAATAVEHGLSLVTRNQKDFMAAPLNVVNPWTTGR